MTRALWTLRRRGVLVKEEEEEEREECFASRTSLLGFGRRFDGAIVIWTAVFKVNLGMM